MFQNILPIIHINLSFPSFDSGWAQVIVLSITGIFALTIADKQLRLQNFVGLFLKPVLTTDVHGERKWKVRIYNGSHTVVNIISIILEKEKIPRENLKFSRGGKLCLPVGEHFYYEINLPKQNDKEPNLEGLHFHIKFENNLGEIYTSRHVAYPVGGNWTIQSLNANQN